MIQSAMETDHTSRPDPSEHASYYATYTAKVPDGDILVRLSKQIEDTTTLLLNFGDAGGSHRYAEGKWSVKEVAGHVMDSERVFAYRAMRIGRGDTTPLPSFEQDEYVRMARFDDIPMADLVDEWRMLRGANVLLFRGLGPEAWSRRGMASGWAVSVRALIWIIAGHELHHGGLLRERYR